MHGLPAAVQPEVPWRPVRGAAASDDTTHLWTTPHLFRSRSDRHRKESKHGRARRARANGSKRKTN